MTTESDIADSRAELLARLSAQIEILTSEPTPSRAGPRGERRSQQPDRSGSGRSGARSARSAEPGAHPEDALGEPEVVARAICLRLLSISARPRAGLADALRRKGIPPEVAGRVLDRFAELGLIDDAAYAEAFVRTKHRDRGLGRTALRRELLSKGIDEQDLVSAIDQVDRDDERARAEQLVAKKLASALAAGPVAARRRLLAALMRRGYSGDLATAVVDAALA